MGTKVRSWEKTVLCGAGLIALSVLSSILGMHIERSRLKALESQQEHISTIAVVNMDNGITMGNEQINYASQLISFPNDHFTVTGLTDAKAGIENGVYAAYIVIPETFSESVTSIENDPRKVMLVYQYNCHLDEEAKIRAANNVNAFIALLNSNIAYMYMDAIMAEFHRIQDDSAAILANDNAERETLAGVNAARLIAAAEPVEEISVDDEIQPVELTSYITQNDALLDYMRSNYSEAVRQGKEDYAAIQKESAEVEAAAGSFFAAYEAAIQNTAAEQTQLLTAGRDKLAEAVGIYNQDVDAQSEKLKSMIADVINMQLEADRNAAGTQLQEILDDLESGDDEALNVLQEQWEKAYQDAQSEIGKSLEQKKAEYFECLEDLIRDIYVQGYNKALTDLSEQADSSVPEDQEYMADFSAAAGEQLNGIYIDWDHLSITLPSVSGNDPEDDGNIGEEAEIVLTAFNDEEAIGNMVSAALALFKTESESEEIDHVIQTYFVDSLSEESRNQLNLLSDAGQQLSQSMEKYESILAEYDPLQYIENADLGAYLNDIGVNAGEMLNTVQQNNSDYMLYASEMYAAAKQHATQVRSSLEEANTQTVQNVESCINDLILSRETINDQNVRLLEGFTGSLKYTRVDSQGNAEVYDYIVNPVVSQSNEQTITNNASAKTAAPVLKKGISVKTALTAVLGIGIILCMAELIMSLRRQYKKS